MLENVNGVLLLVSKQTCRLVDVKCNNSHSHRFNFHDVALLEASVWTNRNQTHGYIAMEDGSDLSEQLIVGAVLRIGNHRGW